ncbi:MAG: hypothetical protein IKT45_01415 [Lachnospiraceae bacterium]|nr:hypothetical protein [Lachnospiraceae bacterium]
MALLKKLLNKDSQEVKEFWKAFNALSKKANQKNLDAFLAAQKVCPDIWQGPFLLSLVYDIKNDLPSDPAKAKNYRDQARRTAQGTEAEEWVSLFYDYYEMSAINWRKSECEYMTEELLAVRKMGVAAMLTYEHKKPVITGHEEFDDSSFWKDMFWTCYDSHNEYEPFWMLFDTWKEYKGAKTSRHDMMVSAASLIKKHNKMVNKYDWHESKILKGTAKEEHYQSFNGMYSFICGYYHIADGPYCFDSDSATSQCGGEMYAGVRYLQTAANLGCAPAVHYLTWMAHADDPDVCNVIRRGLSQDLSADAWLAFYLVKCANAGDSDARAMMDEYYPEKE